MHFLEVVHAQTEPVTMECQDSTGQTSATTLPEHVSCSITLPENWIVCPSRDVHAGGRPRSRADAPSRWSYYCLGTTACLRVSSLTKPALLAEDLPISDNEVPLFENRRALLLGRPTSNLGINSVGETFDGLTNSI